MPPYGVSHGGTLQQHSIQHKHHLPYSVITGLCAIILEAGWLRPVAADGFSTRKVRVEQGSQVGHRLQGVIFEEPVPIARVGGDRSLPRRLAEGRGGAERR